MANLSLLSEFSKALTEVADWWSLVKDDLALEESALLSVAYPQYEGWSEMKEDFQEYYDVVRLLVIVILMQRSYKHSTVDQCFTSPIPRTTSIINLNLAISGFRA